MYVNFARLDEIPPEERAAVIDRLLREMITAHNRELDELREEMRNGDEQREQQTDLG